jgi:NAD(P)-dependent dehydrogenase (short-subunit alcohol dehydrogenase family)
MTIQGLFAVTGGASGIGAGVARALADCGAEVAILDVDLASATNVSREIGGQPYQVDVSNNNQVAEVIETIGPLQGLVACAGVSAMTPIVAIDPLNWDNIIRVNLTGTFYCLQAAARNMIHHATAGSIVAISSVNARFGHRGNGAYGASKAGVEMLVKVAALEFADAGIRVNAIAPGCVESGMTVAALSNEQLRQVVTESIPLGRIGRPDDIAGAAVFLCGAASRWITGQTIAVDGGVTLRVEPKVHSDEEWHRQVHGTPRVNGREGD